MIYLQNACIMYVMQWHTNVWNSLDIDWVYIQHNKMYQMSGLTSPNVSTKLHPKVLAAKSPGKSLGSQQGSVETQWDRSLKIGTSRILLGASIQGEEATAMVETKQRLTGTKPGCIFLARFSHMHYKHQQAASGLSIGWSIGSPLSARSSIRLRAEVRL